MLSSSAGPDRVPLTAMQKARLLVDCLPFPFFVLALVFVLTVLDDITGAPAPQFLILFLGLVILLVGWRAIQRVRDLLAGVALVQDDMLRRYLAARGGGRGRFGEFEHLGRLTLTRKAVHQAQPHRRYRVLYSPASRIVWALEPL